MTADEELEALRADVREKFPAAKRAIRAAREELAAERKSAAILSLRLLLATAYIVDPEGYKAADDALCGDGPGKGDWWEVLGVPLEIGPDGTSLEEIRKLPPGHELRATVMRLAAKMHDSLRVKPEFDQEQISAAFGSAMAEMLLPEWLAEHEGATPGELDDVLREDRP